MLGLKPVIVFINLILGGSVLFKQKIADSIQYLDYGLRFSTSENNAAKIKLVDLKDKNLGLTFIVIDNNRLIENVEDSLASVPFNKETNEISILTDQKYIDDNPTRLKSITYRITPSENSPTEYNIYTHDEMCLTNIEGKLGKSSTCTTDKSLFMIEEEAERTGSGVSSANSNDDKQEKKDGNNSKSGDKSKSDNEGNKDKSKSNKVYNKSKSDKVDNKSKPDNVGDKDKSNKTDVKGKSDKNSENGKNKSDKTNYKDKSKSDKIDDRDKSKSDKADDKDKSKPDKTGNKDKSDKNSENEKNKSDKTNDKNKASDKDKTSKGKDMSNGDTQISNNKELITDTVKETIKQFIQKNGDKSATPGTSITPNQKNEKNELNSWNSLTNKTPLKKEMNSMAMNPQENHTLANHGAKDNSPNAEGKNEELKKALLELDIVNKLQGIVTDKAKKIAGPDIKDNQKVDIDNSLQDILAETPNKTANPDIMNKQQVNIGDIKDILKKLIEKSPSNIDESSVDDILTDDQLEKALKKSKPDSMKKYDVSFDSLLKKMEHLVKMDEKMTESTDRNLVAIDSRQPDTNNQKDILKDSQTDSKDSRDKPITKKSHKVFNRLFGKYLHALITDKSEKKKEDDVRDIKKKSSPDKS